MGTPMLRCKPNIDQRKYAHLRQRAVFLQCGAACLAILAEVMCVAGSADAAVTISTAATSNMSCVSGVCSPTAKDAVLNVSDLTTMLASGNVTVNTATGSLAQ